MRIAILNWKSIDDPQAGGAEVVVDRIAVGLIERGHDVTMLVGGSAHTQRPYRSISTGGPHSQYLRAPMVFRHRARPVDVVLDASNGIPFFSPVWQRAPVVSLVHHVHTEQWAMYFRPPLSTLGRWLESSLAPRVYRDRPAIAVSSSTARALQAMGYRRVTTVEMGIAPFEADAEPDPNPRFVILGRLTAHKRVELALEMWEHVRPITGGELIVIGDGPRRSELAAMAGHGVRFTGRVDEDTKARELAAAWALVHPASHEGWGTVVMEAAAAGVPTIAFDVDGLRDSIVHAETGILAQNRDDFVQQWIRLASDHAWRTRLGAAARTRAQQFPWDSSVERVEEVLAAACDSAARLARV